MKNIFKQIILLVFIITNSACSAFFGTPPDEGGGSGASLGGDLPLELTFAADANAVAYHSVTFTNKTDADFTLDNLAFSENSCGAFSIFNITDTSGNVLYTSGDVLAVTIEPTEAVNINIKFNPVTCLDGGTDAQGNPTKLTEYTTYLLLYYEAAGVSENKTVYLQASVSDNSTTSAACETTEDFEYADGLSDTPPLSTLPDTDGDGSTTYYLRIDKMRAYIQPTGAFTDYAIKVGTDINLENVDPDKLYDPIYLPINSDGGTTDGLANLTLPAISSCDGFRLPSPVTDTNLRGADTVLTTDTLNILPTADEYNQYGSVVSVASTENGSVGKISFSPFYALLYANINNTTSLIQDETTGLFSVGLKIDDLTTGLTDDNSYLEQVADFTDDEGEPFMNIVNTNGRYMLQGKAIRHGTVTLVGIGTFFDDGDFTGSKNASTAVLENPAYIFIQIEGYLTTRK